MAKFLENGEGKRDEGTCVEMFEVRFGSTYLLVKCEGTYSCTDLSPEVLFDLAINPSETSEVFVHVHAHASTFHALTGVG